MQTTRIDAHTLDVTITATDSPSIADNQLVSLAFTRITNALIDDMGEGEIDLISQFATPLPVAVICGLLGIPVSDARR